MPQQYGNLFSKSKSSPADEAYANIQSLFQALDNASVNRPITDLIAKIIQAKDTEAIAETLHNLDRYALSKMEINTQKYEVTTTMQNILTDSITQALKQDIMRAASVKERKEKIAKWFAIADELIKKQDLHAATQITIQLNNTIIDLKEKNQLGRPKEAESLFALAQNNQKKLADLNKTLLSTFNEGTPTQTQNTILPIPNLALAKQKLIQSSANIQVHQNTLSSISPMVHGEFYFDPEVQSTLKNLMAHVAQPTYKNTEKEVQTIYTVYKDLFDQCGISSEAQAKSCIRLLFDKREKIKNPEQLRKLDDDSTSQIKTITTQREKALNAFQTLKESSAEQINKINFTSSQIARQRL